LKGIWDPEEIIELFKNGLAGIKRKGENPRTTDKYLAKGES